MYAVSAAAFLTALIIAGFLIMVLMSAKVTAGLICLSAVIGLAAGLWHVNATFVENEYDEYFGKKYEAEGVIATDPVSSGSNQGGSNQQIILLPDGHSQYIRASLYTPMPNARKGDRVWIRGQLELPENFSDFDYIGYLQRWQVYAVLKKPRVIIIERTKFSWGTGWEHGWRGRLLDFREFVIQQAKAFPPEEGSLIVGMLIGQRQQIPESISNAFKITGLTHIVAVSGFNMTIIATACGALVWYIGRRATNLMTIVIVFGFTVVTGASAAVVRAAIMAVLMVTAQLLGRQYASLYSLTVVAAIMVMQNPRVVMWDVGFQLSVAATFGVLVSFQVKKPDAAPSFLGDLLRPTFGAIVFTAPIIAYHFGTFSVIAPLANLLVLPFVPWIMLLGALSLLPGFGAVFVYPAQLLTGAVLFLTERLSKVPYASIAVQVPAWLLIAHYGAALLYVRAALQKGRKRGKL